MSLELWAGVECTVLKIGERFVDQTKRTGHEDRVDDLDRLAKMGVSKLRYPVLWERTAPRGLASADWSWADERLGRLRELGVDPIVGLVHHGSGPRDTTLTDRDFPKRLAEFAHAVAERYPWVKHFTPINELITTARFSGLYGFWHPHRKSHEAFYRAALVEAEAVRSSMEAIRTVTPDAQLVQTEDGGMVFSTPALAAEAAYQNARQLFGFDLLTGRVGPEHPLYARIVGWGIGEEELASFCERPCPPDVIGLNYYLTSDRWLDERKHLYDEEFHADDAIDGGSGHADIHALVVRREGITGHRRMLERYWDRYHLPLAITEVHLGSTPEAQVRWAVEAWEAAQQARDAGADVRGITLWSVFGSEDWDSLLRLERGHFEPGVFDTRGGIVRETALVSVGSELASTGRSDHPVLADVGSWHLPDRLLAHVHGRSACAPTRKPSPVVQPILVVGAAGRLGAALVETCAKRGLRAVPLTRAECDAADPAAVAAAIAAHEPWAIVHAGGYASVDGADRDPRGATRDNELGAVHLANACAERDLPLVTLSTDLVFDGGKASPYVESDGARPRGVYAATKHRAERYVLEHLPRGLVVRPSTFFGTGHDWLARAITSLAAGEDVEVADDLVVSPSFVPDVASNIVTLLVDGASGIWHLANVGACTPADFVRAAAEAAGVSAKSVVPRSARDLGISPLRPRFSALASERGALMPTLERALEAWAAATSLVDDLAPTSRAA